jgi:O-antigen ligase
MNYKFIYREFIIILLFFLILFFLGGFNAISISQYFYALISFLVPLLVFLGVSQQEARYYGKLFKIFTVTTIVYSLIVIITTFYYNKIMSLLGNEGGIVISTGQNRVSTMIGSSIATSIYFNLNLPIQIYILFNSESKIWKRIGLISIILNIVATILLLSRLSVLVMVVTLSSLIFFYKLNKYNLFKKIAFILITLISVLWIYHNSDINISRIFMGLTDQSAKLRIDSAKLALDIFYEYPIFGSGMGRYFTRLYSDSMIFFNGKTGLVDPHNMYLLILSELGLIGFIFFLILTLLVFKLLSKIKEKNLKLTSYFIFIVLLLNSFGGSHLFFNVSLSVVFWYYLGIFIAVSYYQSENNY